MQSLIVQGLIKLLEKKVELKCLKKDVAIVKEVIEGAIGQYKETMKRETSQDFEVAVSINDYEFLDTVEKEW